MLLYLLGRLCDSSGLNVPPFITFKCTTLCVYWL